MNRYNNKNTSTIVNKINKSKSLPNDIRNSTTYLSRNQSDSSDVFNNQSDDSAFQTKTNKSKRNLSSTSPSGNKKKKLPLPFLINTLLSPLMMSTTPQSMISI
jgi:hypothetical protein